MTKDLMCFLGASVLVKVERPIGYQHGTKGTYLVNYGYIPDTVSGDGEEIDVYLLGTNKPLLLDSLHQGKVIAVIDRHNDIEQKLVAVLSGTDISYNKEEIAAMVAFREKDYDHTIIMSQNIFTMGGDNSETCQC